MCSGHVVMCLCMCVYTHTCVFAYVIFSHSYVCIVALGEANALLGLGNRHGYRGTRVANMYVEYYVEFLPSDAGQLLL